MPWWSGQILTLAIPLLGAALGTIWWGKPQIFKMWGLLVIGLTWVIVAMPSFMSETPPTTSLFFIHLILLGGFLTILGHHSNKETSISLCLTLLFTGLGLGFVASQGPSSSIFLCGIFGLLILTFIRHRRQDWNIPWKAIGVLTVGLLSLLISMMTPDHIRVMALLIPLAIVWPLLPIHGAFIASVSCLPGTLPAFLAVFLPSLGFHGIITLLPVIPEGMWNLLWILALGSALYGSFLACSQNSMNTLLAYAHMALGAILWWCVAVTQGIGPGAVAYVAGLSLVICGLLLASQSVQVRFGHLDLSLSHGLAHSMPWLSTLFVLFITAALGLPIFVLFSAFMTMLLNITSRPAGSFMIILLTWLMSSWYFPRLMQQVLFGRLAPSCKSGHDLHIDERFSLILLLALLVMLGLVPAHWFGAADPAVPIEHLSFEYHRMDHGHSSRFPV